MTNEGLALEYQETGNQDIILQLYKLNRGLMVKTCRHYGKGEEIEDLLQECFFAVCDAARLYNPENGSSFAHYLMFWLKQRVLRYVQDCGNVIRVPIYQRERIRAYHNAITRYRQTFGRDPSPAELARMLDITPEQMKQLKQDAAALMVGSLNSPVRGLDQEGLELQDAIPDNHNHFEEVLEGIQREELAALLWGVVDTLEGRKKDCIRMYFRDDMTYRQIAEKCGVSIETVRQSIESGIRELRKPRYSKRLESFLDEYAYSKGLKGCGVVAFAQKRTSSTERAALKLMALEDKIDYGFSEM